MGSEPCRFCVARLAIVCQLTVASLMLQRSVRSWIRWCDAKGPREAGVLLGSVTFFLVFGEPKNVK
jgi:hypothetical protein